MLYVKKQLDDIEVKFDLYEDEIFSSCPVCGKERQIEPVELADLLDSGGGFSGTSIYCNGCLTGDAS